MHSPLRNVTAVTLRGFSGYLKCSSDFIIRPHTKEGYTVLLSELSVYCSCLFKKQNKTLCACCWEWGMPVHMPACAHRGQSWDSECCEPLDAGPDLRSSKRAASVSNC